MFVRRLMCVCVCVYVCVCVCVCVCVWRTPTTLHIRKDNRNCSNGQSSARERPQLQARTRTCSTVAYNQPIPTPIFHSRARARTPAAFTRHACTRTCSTVAYTLMHSLTPTHFVTHSTHSLNPPGPTHSDNICRCCRAQRWALGSSCQKWARAFRTV